MSPNAYGRGDGKSSVARPALRIRATAAAGPSPWESRERAHSYYYAYGGTHFRVRVSTWAREAIEMREKERERGAKKKKYDNNKYYNGRTATMWNICSTWGPPPPLPPPPGRVPGSLGPRARAARIAAHPTRTWLGETAGRRVGARVSRAPVSRSHFDFTDSERGRGLGTTFSFRVTACVHTRL